jgi:hypothetical protein
MTDAIAARTAAETLADRLERDDFRGFDPYDALASPALRAIARGRIGRTAAIQALKRAPVNVRPLLGVPRLEHTKALALSLSAYARLRRPLDSLADRLERKQDDAGGFGYDFDVQTRWGSYRAGQPNAVATAFALHALLDAGRRDSARRAADFALRRLWVDPWFAYYDGARTCIHNASMLLAGAIERAGGDGAAEAGRAADYAVERQRPDGSWPYGEGPRLGWVDGFHTAYLLDALARFRAHAEALRRGLAFYRRYLLDSDGAARASVDSRYPVETHAAAWAVILLCRVGDHAGAARALDFALSRLRRRDGRFAFRLHRRFRVSIPYVRWSDAHMLLALSEFAHAA